MMHGVVHPWMYQQQQWPPMMVPYQAPPPPAWNQQPPMMAPYQAPPPPAWNQQPPMKALYQAPPPPAWNQQPPMMASYQAPPPPAWNQQPPMMVPYQAPPPPAWNQQPPMMALYQAPPQQLVPQQYSASIQPQPTTSAAEEEVGTLWIGDLQYWMDEAFINLYCFSNTGEVFTSKVIRNKKTGKSKGYGFIVFQSHAIAHRILQRFNGAPMPMMGGTKMRLNWASSSSSSSSSGSGGEKQQQRQEEEEEEEETLITSSVKVAKAITHGHGRRYSIPTGGVGGVGQCGMDQIHYILNDAPLYPEGEEEEEDPNWKYMLEYCRNNDQTQRPEPYAETISTNNVSGPAIFFKDMAYKKVSETDDVAQRVYEIAPFLEMHFLVLEKIGVNPPKFEDLLDELQRYAGSIDVTETLHSIGGLEHLLSHLHSTYAGIRAKVAEVITTMVQYHPRNQQLVLELNDTRLLLFHNGTSDPDATSRTNALGAISTLFWNNKPGITGFELEDIYVSMMCGLKGSSSVTFGFQRKALNFIQHLLHQKNFDYNIVTKLGFPRIMMHLASSVYAEVREAALRCLLVLARVEEGGNSTGQLVKNDDKLKQILLELMEGFSAMAPEVLAATREERQLVDSLWNACYNEPSPFREKKGLLVLPVEDAPVYMTDVSTTLFEP